MPSLVEISQVVLEKNFFLFSSIYFRYFAIISPWKRAGSFFFLTNLNPFHPRVLSVKFEWNWLSGFGEDENVKFTDGRTDRQTDDGQQVIRKTHLSFQLRWGKNDLIRSTTNKITSLILLFINLMYQMYEILYKLGTYAFCTKVHCIPEYIRLSRFHLYGRIHPDSFRM